MPLVSSAETLERRRDGGLIYLKPKKEVWCWPNLSSQTIVWTCEQTSSFESGHDSSTDLAQTQKKEVWCGAKPLAADRCAKGETMAELAAVYGVDQATIWRALQPETAAAA